MYKGYQNATSLIKPPQPEIEMEMIEKDLALPGDAVGSGGMWTVKVLGKWMYQSEN